MTSMRKLRRRLRRWDRYAAKTGWQPVMPGPPKFREPGAWERTWLTYATEMHRNDRHLDDWGIR